MSDETRLKHRPDDALEREEDQHDREQHDGEFDDLADEPEIATVAAEEIKDGGDRDRGKREEEQQANENQGASGGRSTAGR